MPQTLTLKLNSNKKYILITIYNNNIIVGPNP